jgi:hypothetical protein
MHIADAAILKIPTAAGYVSYFTYNRGVSIRNNNELKLCLFKKSCPTNKCIATQRGRQIIPNY